MSETYKVRVGVAAARELEFDVEDPDDVSASYEKAVEDGANILWITDARGHRFGIAVGSFAFIELERPELRGVGFGL